MIFYLSSRDIYLSFSISLSFSFVIVPELFCGEILETFAMLLAIVSAIKSPVASAVFWMTVFEEVLNASVPDCLAYSVKRSFDSIMFYTLVNFYTLH